MRVALSGRARDVRRRPPDLDLRREFCPGPTSSSTRAFVETLIGQVACTQVLLRVRDPFHRVSVAALRRPQSSTPFRPDALCRNAYAQGRSTPSESVSNSLLSTFSPDRRPMILCPASRARRSATHPHADAPRLPGPSPGRIHGTFRPSICMRSEARILARVPNIWGALPSSSVHAHAWPGPPLALPSFRPRGPSTFCSG